MKKAKMIILVGMIGVVSILSVGCSQEEFVKNEITIPSYDAGNVNYVTVQMGDLENREKIFLRTTATEEKEHSFRVSGISLHKVYVAEGDLVEQGQLLAELECEEIKEKLIQLETEAEKIDLEIVHTNELLEEAMQKKDINNKAKEANQDVISRYKIRLVELENDKKITQAMYTEQENKLRDYQICAEMDGVVSRIIGNPSGGVSDEKQAFLVLQSANQLFVGETKGENSFSTGQEITILIGEEEYLAEFLSVVKEGEATSVEVKLKEDSVVPEDCTHGELWWSNGIVEDTLYVLSDAIVSIQEETYVYKKGSDGFAEVVPVETGTVSGEYTQILTGLAEGDEILLY